MKTKMIQGKSIGARVSIILIISIVVSTLAVGIFCYYTYRNNAMSLAGEKAEAIAYSIASEIDGDKFIVYDKTGKKDEYFNHVQATMSEIKKKCEDVYSMVDDGEEYKYIISGFLDGEIEEEGDDFCTTDSKSLYVEAAAVLEDGISCYAKPQKSDYGLLISGYAPIFNSAEEVVGFVGTDINVNDEVAKVNQIIPILAIMILITSIILFTISYRFINKTISKPLREIAEKSRILAYGDTDIDMDEKYLNRMDEIGLLGRGFVDIAQNTKEQAEVASKIAKGDLMIGVVPRSEKDILAISMASVLDALKNLVTEANQMTENALAGKLEHRGDAEKFAGGYRDIINGFNQTLDAVIDPLKRAANYMERISKGDIPDHITGESKGDFNQIKNSINTCISAVNAMIEDAEMLSAAAVNGQLEIRADVSRHGGHFAKIIEGVNQTLNSVIGPLDTAANYIDLIGKGQIPSKIEGDYQGDFNKIKNSINACIDGLSGLVEGRDALQAMSNNDYTRTIEGEYLGIFSEIAKSINFVSERITDSITIINHIALGNLKDLNSLKETGKRSENDTLMPAMITMTENIKALVEETTILSTSAIEGNLNIRGDSSKFMGEYGRVIEGINETLDAVNAPVQEAFAVLNEMAKGNLHTRMEGDYKGDHAELKNSLNETIENLLNYISDISYVLTEIGNGNLDLEITTEYKGNFEEIKNSLIHIILTLNQIMGDINDAADQVTSGSRQVSDGSQALSQGSTEQASSIEELTESMEQIASQTKQNAVNANQASDLAVNAKEDVIKGNGKMQEMLTSMEDISQSSTNISKIIKVIDDIAFQTNILALNAAVEAARAGQHGKGFAVVAEEVRNLAVRSAEAAKETTALIEGSINKVQTGTQIANDTAASLDEVVAEIEKSANLISSIAMASNDQASGIEQINRGIEQVSKVIQNNSATAEESAAASEELSGQSEVLKQMVSRFKLGKEKDNQIEETKYLNNETEANIRNQSVPEKVFEMNSALDKY